MYGFPAKQKRFAYNPIILDKKQQFMPNKDGSCQKYSKTEKKEYDKRCYEMLCSFWEMNG